MTIRSEQLSLFGTLIRGVLIAVFITAAGVVSGVAQGGGAHKRVLFVFNNDSFTVTQARMDQALRATLKEGLGVEIETYSEYVGDTRAGSDYEKEFVALIKRKYEGKKFDLIYAVTNPTLRILTRNRAELFPDAPIVLLSLDKRDLANVNPAIGITGVTGEISFKPNLDIALAQYPGTKRVVLMNGLNETDKYWTERAQNDFKEYESRVEFSNLTGLTVPEMRNALANLPPDTIAFFVTNVRDREGNIYESPEYLRQVASASTVPIYGTTEAQLGMGIVGGFLVSFEALGVEGGKVGLRLLAGEDIRTFPPTAIAPAPLFDGRQLQQWGISEASLPAGSTVRFKQPSVWDEYKWYAIGLLAAVIVETLLIVFLIYLRLRRRQAEAQAARLSSRITEIVSNVPGIVWESRLDPTIGGRRTTFISDYVKRMLGYTAEEWLKQPPGFGLTRVPKDEREKVRRESDEVMETGKEAVSAFRWQAKDGQFRWVENYLSPLVETGKGIIGLRGVALDVTDRKLAEEHAREAEEKDKAILSAIPDLMFIQTLDGVYVDYHATDPEALFVSPETFLGKNYHDVLPPDLAQRFSECFELAEEDGEPQIVEYQLNILGQNRWYEARVVRAGDKHLSMIRDITDRVSALEELLRSEERFGKAFRANPQPMSITTVADGRFIDVNDSFVLVSGYPRDEVIGRTTAELGVWARPEDREAFVSAVQSNGSIVNVETEFRSKNGTVKRLLTSAERLELGGEDCLLVASTDITERYAAEEALRASESFNRTILSSLNTHVCVMDRQGRIISVNRAWSDFALDNGLESEASVGPGVNYLDVCWSSANDGDEVARFAMEGIRAVCEGRQEYFKLEYPCHSPKEKRWFLVIVTPLKRGQGGAVVVHNDVTDSKLAAEKVRESEERFRNMAETAPVTIWISDENRATTFVNKRWLEVTGSTLEEEVGSGWSKHVHPDDVGAMVEVYATAFENRVPFEFEFRVLRVDGEYRWFFTSGTPRLSSEGGFLGYIGTAIDITERKRAESELKKAHDELHELKNQLEAENIYLQEELRQDQAFGDIVGQSSAIKYVLFKVSQVAPTVSTVLVTGETGTGKELVARAIHEASPRKDRPLIRVNCAALSASLIESELFGHERGAFTGAAARKLGRFELANTGTILLDEIGELPLDLQGKLLRVLQEGEFERVGSGKTIKTDVRIIASTNRDLKQAVEKGKFREDLWYRLNVFPITTPPLRDRRDDIPLLTEHFARTFARKFGKELTAVSPETLTGLCTYSWPGNVRELANVIERAIINLRGPVLKIHEDFPIREADMLAASVKTLEDMERDHIRRVLEDLNWRIDGPRGAARILGINPSTLRTRMVKLGITKPNGRPGATSPNDNHA